MAVRPACPADLPAVAAIAGEVVEDAWTPAQLAEELERPLARCLVVEVSRQVAGFAVVWHVADEASLLLMAVGRPYQRRGLGRRLLDAVEAGARGEGMAVVLLEVRSTNLAARALYRSAGYAETGVRRGYYASTGEDAVLMQRALI